MSDICVPWQQTRYCYAHEQCRLATRQWSRLLDSMLSVGLAKASPFCGPAVDPCLTRLVNSADDCESVSSRGSLAGRSDTAELRPACRHCCSEEDADTGARHAGWRRNGVTPWKSSAKMYSPGIKGYNIIQMMHGLWVGHWNMMNPRLKMLHEGAARVRHFQPRIIFQCRTNDRASYVLSYGQPLAQNCILSSEMVEKREWVLSVI